MTVSPQAVDADGAAFSEGHLMVLVIAVWFAVMIAPDVPLLIGGIVIASGVLSAGPGRVRLLVVAVGLVVFAAGRGSSAEEAYQPAAAETLVRSAAVLVTDTEPSDFGWRAEARLDGDGRRVQLVGAGFPQPDLVAGQPIVVSGRLGPVDETPWHKSRHLVGVVSSAEIVPGGALAWFRRPGEWLRAGVLGATASFDDDQASLYHGLVIGDDRFQSVGQRAQFRAAGLTHLLAVSGQNVSFLLAIFAPFTRRLRPSAALACVVALLIVFALATRLEPSVLRATVTAGVSTLATVRSARSAGLRSLALAVVVLLLVDPFLAWSIGFRLSVAASAGILLLAPLIRSRLAAPDWLAGPVSITLAAQTGVSPILLLAFGPIATVTIPANVLVGWAAGAVMTLGLTVGIVASLLPEAMAGLLQLPARWLVWWIDVVAAEAARAPLPALSIAAVPWVGIVGVISWWVRPARVARFWWLLPLALVSVVSSTRRPQIDGWFDGVDGSPSVLVIEDPNERWVDVVVAGRKRAVDVVIVADGGWSTARTIERLRDVIDIGTVLAPSDHRIVGGRRMLVDTVIDVRGGQLEISVAPSELEIDFVVGAAPVDG